MQVLGSPSCRGRSAKQTSTCTSSFLSSSAGSTLIAIVAHNTPLCCTSMLHQYATGSWLCRHASKPKSPLACILMLGMLPAGKDLRSIFTLLKRNPKTGAVPAHAGLLLHMLCTMARHEGPTAYFDFANEVGGCSAECLVTVESTLSMQVDSAHIG